jgi:glycosyltransferase involved in cell wall biosynthesis
MNKWPAATSLTVFHVMRTYGNHGGERQLAQMFAQPAPTVDEHFAFLYRDNNCEQLFASGAKLQFHRIWPFAVRPRYSAWGEMALLLPLLPWMQLRLLGLLLWHRPQVCIVHGFQAALVAWPAAILLGGKTGFAYFHRIAKSYTGRHPLFRLIYAPYQKLIGVSLAVKASLSGLADASRLDALENGVDVERIRQALSTTKRHTPPVVIAIGRLLPHKGQLLIIEAFEAYRKEFPDMELWIVGNGEYRTDLEAAARKLGSSVQFLGRREDIPELLAAATIFCNASDWEGMSNAVLEAMAAGLPSVVTDAPGVTECHINNATGFVVERNVKALADKLAVLMHDPELRQRMGQAALQRVREKYSIQANRKKYISLYYQLAGMGECAG